MERSPRWRKPLLIIHIVTAISLIGTALALVALGVAGLRGDDPATIYPAAYLVEAWVVAPLAVIALASGLLLSVTSGWGLFRHGWVTTKLLTTSGFVVLVFLVLIPRLASSADSAIEPAGQTFETAQRLPLAIAPALAVTVLILNVTLAVYKPGRRSRPGEPESVEHRHARSRRGHITPAGTGKDS